MKNDKALIEPFNSLYKLFASVQLTVVLLLALALTSIIGTLIPQNQSPQEYLRAFGQFRYTLFSVLDLFDMYHAWWFQLLLILLTANIIVCSLDRLPRFWRTVMVKKAPLRRSRFKRAGARATVATGGEPEKVVQWVAQSVAKGFGRPRRETDGEIVSFYVDKWRWSRLGVYVVHFSIVLLLIGGLVGSLFGFDGFVNIAEGETVDMIRLRSGNQGLKLPFKIRCDDFNVRFYPTGEPEEFRSALTLLDADDQVLTRKEIIVNDPLRYQGISLYQSNYGELPPQGVDHSLLDTIVFTLNMTSTASGISYPKKAKVHETVELPEKLGTFTLEDYLPLSLIHI